MNENAAQLLPRPSTPRSRAIPLLLLCIGYLSIIPFGALYLADNLERLKPFAPPFSVYELLPIIGFALIFGYRQAASGKKPWGTPRIFWFVSILFNIGMFYFIITRTPLGDVLGIPAQLAKSLWEAFAPVFNPRAALSALADFVIFSVIVMPVVAVLSCVEARRAFLKTKPDPTARPDPECSP